jgi:hypothetical protein
MSTVPPLAECRSILADVTLLTITATRRARAGRAEVKCSAAGDGPVAARMQEVVRLARHTETRFDTRDQVLISMDRTPDASERDWELAVVLADRMVRGLWQPRGAVVANGWSDAWQLGRIAGHDVHDAPSDTLLGGPGGLAHLGQLNGHPDPSSAVSSARAWFPLHAGGDDDSLCWVEVSVHPLPHDPEQEEETIAVPGRDAALQLAVRQALAGARHFDGRGQGRWRTTVRFGEQRFQGRSFELALVLADRIARGREFLPRGRLIASGCSQSWHAGRVDTVEGMAPKCALLLRAAAAGDRILLPQAWQAGLPDSFAEALRAMGASLACVERIGVI